MLILAGTALRAAALLARYMIWNPFLLLIMQHKEQQSAVADCNKLDATLKRNFQVMPERPG